MDGHRLPASLCARTESRRIHLGLLEAARATQHLSQGLLGTERSGAPNAASHAPPSATDHCLLEAIFFVVKLTLYYARLNKRVLGRTPVDSTTNTSGPLSS